jgi:hypothetical protein
MVHLSMMLTSVSIPILDGRDFVRTLTLIARAACAFNHPLI